MNRIISMIKRRSGSVNSVIETTSINLERRYEMIERDLEKGVANQNRINEYFYNIADVEHANSNRALSIIEKCNNVAPLYANILTNIFTKDILPCLDAYKGVLNELANYNLTNDQISNIKEAVEDIVIADRIKNNHDKLSEKADLDIRISSIGNESVVRNIVENVYNVVKDYNIADYQKMNVELEEVTYLFEKSGYDYSKYLLYKTIIETYLINTDVTVEEVEKVFEANKLIDKKEIEGFIDRLKNIKDTKDMINIFPYYIQDKKNLAKTLKECIENTEYDRFIPGCVYFYRFMDLVKEASKYNDLLLANIESRDLDREDLIDIRECVVGMHDLSDGTRAIIKTLEDNLNDQIALKYPLYNRDCIRYYINNESVEAIPLNEFGLKFNALTKIVDKFNRFLKRKEKSSAFQNMKRKFSGFSGNKSKLTSMLFGEGVTLSEALGSDNKVDVTVMLIPFDESDNVIDLSNEINKLVYEFNHEIELDDHRHTCRSYYTMIEGMIEIHIKDRTPLDESGISTLNEDYTEPDEKEFQDSLAGYDFSRISDTIDQYKTKKLKPVVEYLDSVAECDNFTLKHFELALEALSYLGVEKSDVERFANRFLDNAFNSHLMKEDFNNKSDVIPEDTKVTRLVENWESNNCGDLEISLEAYDLLISIFEDAGMKNVLAEDTLEDRMKKGGFYTDDDEKADKVRNEKEKEEEEDKDDSDDNDEEEKKPSKSGDQRPSKLYGKPQFKFSNDDVQKKTKLSLNDIVLALKGLQGKFKNFNSKQKEVSRNMDAAVRHYVKSIKDAQSNERREQIIRGSVIPSFSKCLKFGIMLAGMGGLAAAGIIPAVVPVIVGIGGFAMDKRLTAKERYLILDEIDTELDVIDKELNMADSNNQINKYRALLRYKKELQRQYQRIRYNIRVGKDMHPDVNAGLAIRN